MLSLDPDDPGFQAFIRKELSLGDDTRFASCDAFRGTRTAENCIGIASSPDNRVFVLLRGSFHISGDALILELPMPGAPDPTVPRKELIEAGFAPKMTRFVGVCVNTRAGREEAKGEPEIQVILIPY